MNQRNYVAKHSHKYNTLKIYTDRKKRLKQGYTKHKGKDNTSIAIKIIAHYAN